MRLQLLFLFICVLAFISRNLGDISLHISAPIKNAIYYHTDRPVAMVGKGPTEAFIGETTQKESSSLRLKSQKKIEMSENFQWS